MINLFQYLEDITRKERVIQKSERHMNSGETWSLLVELRKGVEYSVYINSRGSARCSVVNGDPATPLAESWSGKKTPLRIRPDQNGFYRIIVNMKPTGDFNPGKVTTTIREKYIPAHILARFEADCFPVIQG